MDQQIKVRPTFKEGDKVRLLDNAYRGDAPREFLRPGSIGTVTYFGDGLDYPVSVVFEEQLDAYPWPFALSEVELVEVTQEAA